MNIDQSGLISWLKRSSLFVIFVCYHFGIDFNIQYEFMSQVIPTQDLKFMYKALCLDEGKCKFIDEIDQDTAALPASQNRFLKEGSCQE